MRGTEFDEAEFFRSVARVRALLIGRRALIALGIPVLTADYDLWVHVDDIEALNISVEVFDLAPNRSPEEARRLGRYVLENDEHVDVLVGSARTTVDGMQVRFDDVWDRRRLLEVASGVRVAVPSLDDLIATKKLAARPKDAEDIRLLEALRDVPEEP